MQLPLFEPGTGLEDLEAAPLPEGVRALAARLPSGLRLGGQSWVYPGWIGLVYGPGVRQAQLLSRGLTAYSKHPLLRAMEIDRTYYEPVPAAVYEEYAAQVPDGFRFPAKAHQDCTVVVYPGHARYGARAGQRNPRLLEAAYAADRVVAPFVEGLGAKAGPLLFQFSPFEVRSPARFAEKLHDFLRRLPRGPTYAVELRNEELLTEAYGRALEDTGVMHCHNAWGRMPGVLEQRARLPAATRRVLLARWLGPPGVTHEAARRKYEPFNRLVDEDAVRRGELATLAADALAEGSEGYVMVNNKAEGCAPESIRKLAEAIARAPRGDGAVRVEVAEDADSLWREAIAQRKVVRFTFDGEVRLAEPHEYGVMKGVARVLVYQLAGGSRSGGLPDWRLITVARASKPELIDVTFQGPRLSSTGQRHHWDRLFASVSRAPFG